MNLKNVKIKKIFSDIIKEQNISIDNKISTNTKDIYINNDMKKVLKVAKTRNDILYNYMEHYTYYHYILQYPELNKILSKPIHQYHSYIYSIQEFSDSIDMNDIDNMNRIETIKEFCKELNILDTGLWNIGQKVFDYGYY